MTRLYFHLFSTPCSSTMFARHLKTLPVAEQERVGRHRVWMDACASLAGKLLLRQALTDFGCTTGLEALRRDAHDKPYLEGCNLGFNISHSGNLVACIMTDETSDIGLDVEKFLAPQIMDFTECWNETEQEDINAGGAAVFYKYWTIKEAVIKASGIGLAADMKEITIKGNDIAWAGKPYHIHFIDSLYGFALTVASAVPVTEPSVEAVFSLDLFSSGPRYPEQK